MNRTSSKSKSQSHNEMEIRSGKRPLQTHPIVCMMVDGRVAQAGALIEPVAGADTISASMHNGGSGLFVDHQQGLEHEQIEQQGPLGKKDEPNGLALQHPSLRLLGLSLGNLPKNRLVQAQVIPVGTTSCQRPSSRGIACSMSSFIFNRSPSNIPQCTRCGCRAFARTLPPKHPTVVVGASQ